MNTLDFPGKKAQQRFCKLKFSITPVITIDNEIFSLTDNHNIDMSKVCQMFKDIHFQLTVDRDIIFDSKVNFKNTVNITKFIDDLQSTTHEICLKLLGKNDSHTWKTDWSAHATVALQLYFELEDLPMTSVFYEVGSYKTDTETKIASLLMGENGTQHLQIECPIYPWLLKNRKLINQDLES